MHLSALLDAREKSSQPVRVALVGAGKFGCMFLAQADTTPGLHVTVIVDVDVVRCAGALKRVGWSDEKFGASDIAEAMEQGSTLLTDRVEHIAHEAIDVVIDATGHVVPAVDHALMAFDAGKHVVMVTVEADAVAGPMLAERARRAGVVYSMAYGDQPALICELVDWARSCGFDVTCAGKGTKYLPEFHQSTPDTIWEYYGFTEQQVASGDYNPRMFNSFLDGTKSAIEMAAVSNATGLQPGAGGLAFPPCPADRLASVCVPREAGGVLDHSGTVEVVSSSYRDGSEVDNDLRWGVYITFETDSEYVRRCFGEYGAQTDPTGRYAALYRPTHFIGLELGYSVAKAALAGEATGTPSGFIADVVAVAKRDLAAGERLDGEGGYTVYGRLTTAATSVQSGGLPLGLAADLTLRRPIESGQMVRWSDVEPPAQSSALSLRREMESLERG